MERKLKTFKIDETLNFSINSYRLVYDYLLLINRDDVQQIYSILLKDNTSSITVNELIPLLNKNQATVSQLLARMRKFDLVSRGRDRKTQPYYLTVKQFKIKNELSLLIDTLPKSENYSPFDGKSFIDLIRCFNSVHCTAILNYVNENAQTNVYNIYRSLSIEQSMTSDLLARLINYEIVSYVKSGKEHHYTVNTEFLKTLQTAVNKFHKNIK